MIFRNLSFQKLHNHDFDNWNRLHGTLFCYSTSEYIRKICFYVIWEDISYWFEISVNLLQHYDFPKISITEIACMGLYFVIQHHNTYAKCVFTKSEKIFLSGSKFPGGGCKCLSQVPFSQILRQEIQNSSWGVEKKHFLSLQAVDEITTFI